MRLLSRVFALFNIGHLLNRTIFFYVTTAREHSMQCRDGLYWQLPPREGQGGRYVVNDITISHIAYLPAVLYICVSACLLGCLAASLNLPAVGGDGRLWSVENVLPRGSCLPMRIADVCGTRGPDGEALRQSGRYVGTWCHHLRHVSSTFLLVSLFSSSDRAMIAYRCPSVGLRDASPSLRKATTTQPCTRKS